MSLRQYLRECRLVVEGGDGQGLDLSDLHLKFTITKSDAQSPNVADVTVYNLADDTARRIRDEFTVVTLEAGYRGNVGVIFRGNIKQVRVGRESATDTYLNIAAADGDAAYNGALVNVTLAAGATQSQQVEAAARPMSAHGVDQGFTADLGATKLPRGKAMFGLSREYLRQSALASGTTWSIQDGRLQLVKRTGVLPGQAILLTPDTGLVGAPEQTDKGVTVQCLLNPQLRVGGKVKLDNSLVNLEKVQLATPKGGAGATPSTPAAIAADGVYRLLVVEYSGDTRGGDWYCNLTCLGVDETAPADAQVDPE